MDGLSSQAGLPRNPGLTALAHPSPIHISRTAVAGRGEKQGNPAVSCQFPVVVPMYQFIEPAFTNFFLPLKIGFALKCRFLLSEERIIKIIARWRATGAEIIMGTSGELIRLINYVDDITTTLRRISAFVAAMESDEKKRLAESLKAAGSNLDALVVRLEKGGQ
jgi:hypothetical protein